MAIEECNRNVYSDSDDDAPLIFKRTTPAPKQGQSSSAPRKVQSQKGDGSLGKVASDQRALNGQSSNPQKAKVASSAKLSSHNSTVVSKGSLALQSRLSSENRTPSRDLESTRIEKSHAGPVKADDSDDDKPLFSRTNPANMAVQNSTSMHAKNPLKQSSNKLESKEMKKIIQDKSYVGVENSDNHKTARTEFSTTRVETQRSTSLPETEVLGSPSTLPAGNKVKEDVENYSDDSEDGKPLAARFQSKSNSGAPMKKPTDAEEKTSLASRVLKSPVHMPSSQKIETHIKKDLDDSDDDKTLVSRFQAKSGDGLRGKKLSDSDSDDDKPLNARLKPNGSAKKEPDAEPSKTSNKRPLGSNNLAESSFKKAKVLGSSSVVSVKHESVVKKEQKKCDDDDDDDDIPISQRMKKAVSPDKQSSLKKVKKIISKKQSKSTNKLMKNSKFSKSMSVPPGSGGGQKWTTLEHCGVIFPPPYKPHGVKMLYNGQPVDLTSEQEEVATMFAVMKETDYASKPKFIENFMNDWSKVLGKNHVIKKFELCDFTPIFEWHLAEKEKKKLMTSEVLNSIQLYKLQGSHLDPNMLKLMIQRRIEIVLRHCNKAKTMLLPL